MEELPEDPPTWEPTGGFFTILTNKPDPTIDLVKKWEGKMKMEKNNKKDENKKPPSRRDIGRGPFSSIRVRPVAVTDPNDPWSTVPSFEEGTVTFENGGTFKFGSATNTKYVQADPGCSAGFSCDTATFNRFVGESTSWCWSEYAYSHSKGVSRAAIVEIKIPSIQLSTFTFAVEVPELPSPLLGRFMVSDLLSLLNQGALANPISLPVDKNGKLTEGPLVPVKGGFYSLNTPPDYQTARKRLIDSPLGQEIRKGMLEEYAEAVDEKKGNRGDLALIKFQRVSVYGSFVFTNDELASTYRALASTYRDEGNPKLALVWANRSKSLRGDRSIDRIITGIGKLV